MEDKNAWIHSSNVPMQVGFTYWCNILVLPVYQSDSILRWLEMRRPHKSATHSATTSAGIISH